MALRDLLQRSVTALLSRTANLASSSSAQQNFIRQLRNKALQSSTSMSSSAKSAKATVVQYPFAVQYLQHQVTPIVNLDKEIVGNIQLPGKSASLLEIHLHLMSKRR